MEVNNHLKKIRYKIVWIMEGAMLLIWSLNIRLKIIRAYN